MISPRNLRKMKTFLESFCSDFNPEINTINKAFDICFGDFILEGMEELNATRQIKWGKYTSNPMVKGGLEIMQKINSAGHQAYLVGGAVRDLVMGTKISDFDIATNMPIPEIKKHFKTIDITKGEEFGVVVVRYKDESYELAQFRTEKGYSDKRRPDEIQFVSSILQDIKRRDFTFGAMFVDVKGNLYDPEGGLKDIEAKKIKTVGKAEERFTEDTVRMLRAISFAVRLGFDIEPEVEQAIGKLKEQLKGEPADRFRKEIKEKIMAKGKDKFQKALALFEKYGLFQVMFPEIVVTEGKRNAIAKANSGSMIVNFAILMHDLGVEEIGAFAGKNKMTIEERRAIKYIVSHLKNYGNLDKIDKQVAVEIILDDNFSELRKAFVALNGTDIPNAEEIIKKVGEFSSILRRQKDINQIILAKGIEGAKFGEVVKKTRSWLFNEFEKGNEPRMPEIAHFIDSII